MYKSEPYALRWPFEWVLKMCTLTDGYFERLWPTRRDTRRVTLNSGLKKASGRMNFSSVILLASINHLKYTVCDPDAQNSHEWGRATIACIQTLSAE
jgi:hypothetical protein